MINKTGIKRYLENLAVFHNPQKPLKVRLFTSALELGFTDNKCVWINGEPEKIDKALAPPSVIILGVFAHELLHTIFTDFNYANMLLNKFSSKFGKMFMFISNLVEDSAIENFAPSVFGGSLLKALRYTIKTTFISSPPISEAKNPWQQFIGALIDIGDLGYYKGEFTFNEAKEMYEKVLPLFYEATIEPKAKKRVDMAVKITEMTAPLWDEFFEEPPPDDIKRGSGEGKDFDGKSSSPMDKTGATKSFKSEKGKTKSTKSKSKSGDGSSSGISDGGSSDDDKAGGNADDKADGKTDGKADGKVDDGADDKDSENSDNGDKLSDESKDSDKPKDGDKTDDKTDNDDTDDDGKDEACDDDEVDDENEDVDDDDDGEISEDDFFELSEEELKELMENIQTEAEKASAEVAKEEAYTEKVQPTGFGRTLCIAPSKGNESALNNILSQNAVSVRSLKRGLEDIFERDVDSLETATSGQLNVSKFAKSKTSVPTAKIFDKRRIADGKQDVSVLLLVDESGSMAESNIRNAKTAAIILSKAFVELKIPLAVVGFTADERCYEPDHRIYLDFGDKQLKGLTLLSARCQNRDGDSIRFATAKLSERTESNRILFVISDGEPAANNYWGKPADDDTQNAVKEARKNGITVFSIGVGSSAVWQHIYGDGNYVTISNPAMLPGMLLKRIKKIINKE